MHLPSAAKACRTHATERYHQHASSAGIVSAHCRSPPRPALAPLCRARHSLADAPSRHSRALSLSSHSRATRATRSRPVGFHCKTPPDAVNRGRGDGARGVATPGAGYSAAGGHVDGGPAMLQSRGWAPGLEMPLSRSIQRCVRSPDQRANKFDCNSLQRKRPCSRQQRSWSPAAPSRAGAPAPAPAASSPPLWRLGRASSAQAASSPACEAPPWPAPTCCAPGMPLNPAPRVLALPRSTLYLGCHGSCRAVNLTGSPPESLSALASLETL